MHHISVTWHFRRCKLFFFWIPSVRRTICCHFHENRCYFIFSTLYNLNIYLWPLKPHNFKSMCRISKIITFLESLRQAGWFDLFKTDIQALLIFDPLITLWGNFDAPYLKLLNDASVASACFYVRTCRSVRNSKKIATIRDFHLPGSFLCLSTRLKPKSPRWKCSVDTKGRLISIAKILTIFKILCNIIVVTWLIIPVSLSIPRSCSVTQIFVFIVCVIPPQDSYVATCKLCAWALRGLL